MSEENKQQKLFLKAIDRAIEKAYAAHGCLIQAQKIGGTNEVAVNQYQASLQAFVNACDRMKMEIGIFFGEGPEEIVTRAAGFENRNPHVLN
jgi:hypothetical protein